MHDLPLIATLAAAFTSAWLLGLLAQWLRLSPIVGYLLAGILIGPHTPGFVGDLHIAQQLAEVGVILLMFGVGLHFHLKDLMAVRDIAIPGAVGQSVIATVVAMAVFSAFGMPLKTGAVLGMAMAVASTVVLMRVLMDANVLSSPQGHAAVGWLIVEDVFTVVLLVLIPVLSVNPDSSTSPAGGFWGSLGLAMLKLLVLVAIVMWAGSKFVPRVLVRVAKLRSRELFTLTVLVFSVAVAAASYFFFGASMALGAFLAGMVVAQSPVSHQAAADALPMRDTFAVLFFVSVGMLFDPAFLIDEPLMILAALGVVMIAKPLAALVIVAALGHSVRTGLTVAVGLAQIGEFSFILSDLSRRFGLMPDSGHNVLVAAAILSITLNPMLFRALPRFEAGLRKHPALWKLLNRRAERRATRHPESGPARPADDDAGSANPAIVVGYGPVGRSVHQVLEDSGVPTVVVDMNMDTVAELHQQGKAAIFGDASHLSILAEAGAAKAAHLIVTVPDGAQRAAILAAARSLSSKLRIIVRARYLQERQELERAGASAAVFEEAEAAVALARMVIADAGLRHEAAARKLQDIRLKLIMDNISNIRSQRVSSVMVPWSKVRTLSTADDHRAVLDGISRQRFSRWPVVNPAGRLPVGYLLAKDLISFSGEGPWTDLVRPLKSVPPDASVDATLTRMQDEGATIYLVESAGVPHGMITMEDILEQVVGRLDDEQTREIPVTVEDAVNRGAVLTGLAATSRDQVIRELAAAVPAKFLPGGFEPGRIRELALAREQEISTDLGNGIALPHARIPDLPAPIIVIGHSEDGVLYSTESKENVHLFFLILTPEQRPETQLALLGQLARMAGDETTRRALFDARTPVEITEILHHAARRS